MAVTAVDGAIVPMVARTQRRMIPRCWMEKIMSKTDNTPNSSDGTLEDHDMLEGTELNTVSGGMSGITVRVPTPNIRVPSISIH
jgi:hypothetical protein